MVRFSKNSNLSNVFLGIIAVFVLGVIFVQLKTVLMPFVIAILLSIICKPMILWLRNKGIPMFAALFGVLLLFSPRSIPGGLGVVLVNRVLYSRVAGVSVKNVRNR